MNFKIANIDSIEQLEDFDDEYVYDIEMADDPHTFFANDILIHNSVMFDASGIVNDILGKKNKKLSEANRDDVLEICAVLDKFVEHEVNMICRKAVAKQCFSPDSNRINFSREIFGPAAAFFKKKKYFIYVWDKEGIEKNNFKYTGLEIKQTSLPKTVKGLLQNIFEQSCKENWNNEIFQKHIAKIWEDFTKLDWEDAAQYKGNNSYKEPENFLMVKKGTTGSAKAAIYYAQLLEKLGLDKKYPPIVLGEKLRFCYIKPNAFGIKVIAFPDEMPPEFKEFFNIDYNVMFQKMLIKPLELFCKIRGWDQFKPGIVSLENIFDL